MPVLIVACIDQEPCHMRLWGLYFKNRNTRIACSIGSSSLVVSSFVSSTFIYYSVPQPLFTAPGVAASPGVSSSVVATGLWPCKGKAIRFGICCCPQEPPGRNELWCFCGTTKHEAKVSSMTSFHGLFLSWSTVPAIAAALLGADAAGTTHLHKWSLCGLSWSWWPLQISATFLGSMPLNHVEWDFLWRSVRIPGLLRWCFINTQGR